ncbi:TPA: GNAT family N-acetyltransferase [Burkholderia territorii]|uniref:GNAT family N-acetyltransferase n=2 Tax=Burkholderia territorii TaxID=1503055 RepID=UPI0011CC953A|nr:GNAT family N-acetyltransferase [Burkholderia territorii]TXG19454.1 GNAT family N-acetyltransferase [Burkholderia territorii]HDR8860082.1 GNAT family N-acetyltransferase [Burkholderia territorii]HDR8866030.1 GNAT family N-acetyltransferase [Burkholderia territorii]HDR8872634.1 GNAT family N-acetyltransferase [Burkholderia territorii]HDR8878953.1 GNAT family N-acetyltransferase [Burkholderia territorii]
MTDGWVETGDWAVLGGDAARIRDAVFVREQRIPPEWELDDEDPVSLHVVAYRVDAATGARRAVATGRLLRTGTIGRVAVLADARGQGAGSAVLHALLDAARQRGEPIVRLYALVAAVPFYVRHGFAAIGEPFVEIGVPHVEMVRAP